MKNSTLAEKLDDYDRMILAELQHDGRVAVAELAERIGLSVTLCWRRVHHLKLIFVGAIIHETPSNYPYIALCC